MLISLYTSCYLAKFNANIFFFLIGFPFGVTCVFSAPVSYTLGLVMIVSGNPFFLSATVLKNPAQC